MTKYTICEMPDVRKNGEKKTYAKVELVRNLNFQEFMERCMQTSTAVSKVAMEAAMRQITENLAFYMGMGYSVTLDGLGTFKAKLGTRKGKKKNAEGENDYKPSTLGVAGVHFRADKKLVKRTDEECDLEHGDTVMLSTTPYTREERLQKALEYLDKHEFLRVRDYMILVQMRQSTATLELNRFCKNPDSGISSKGSRSSKVYVKSNTPTKEG